MTDSKQTKQNEKKNGINPLAAVVTGVIVGAGVAVAGAVAMSDKKNRDNVKKVLANAKNQAIGYAENLQKQAEVKKDEIEVKVAEGKGKVKKVVSAAK